MNDRPCDVLEGQSLKLLPWEQPRLSAPPLVPGGTVLIRKAHCREACVSRFYVLLAAATGLALTALIVGRLLS